MVNYRSPTNIRFPPELHEKIKSISAERMVSFAQVVIEACYQYVEGAIPGQCPSCHVQNDPEAQYCQSCGGPLTEEAEKTVAAVTRLTLDPSFIRALFEKEGINQMEERNNLGIAINTIYRLQKKIDELQPVVDWAKKKMEEEGKEC
jgi:transposase-like protein